MTGSRGAELLKGGQTAAPVSGNGLGVRRGRGQKRGAIARVRMLDAGLAAFAGLSLDELLAEVGPRRVMRELGDVSAGAFYHHFPDRLTYLKALIEHALGPRADHVAPQTVTLLRELAEAPDPDVIASMDEACRADFDRSATVGLVAQRFQVAVWAAHEEPEVREALRCHYLRFTAPYMTAYEQLLERWGREFRPPFTTESAAVIFTALLEGLLLRACVDSHVDGPELFSRTLLALLPVMTRTQGDADTLDDAVNPIGDLPRSATVKPEDPTLRQRALDAALARADAGTFEYASLDDIARDAGLDPDVVHRRFLSKPGLAAATFARFVPLLQRPVTRDLEEGRPPVEIIRGHLTRLADVAARHRGLTNALLDTMQTATIRYGNHIGPHDPRAVVPLSQILEPAVAAGQCAGVVRDDFDAFELAATVTNLLLLRAVSHQHDSAENIAKLVSEVALFGIAVND
jgi:AcrR family transcriptional regulator